MAINITALGSGDITTVSSGTTISSTTENNNNNALKNKINEIITEVNDINMDDMTSSSGDEDLLDAMENYISGCFITIEDTGTDIRVSSGTVMINGKLRRNTSNTDTDPGTDPGTGDYLDVWVLADAAATTFTVSLVDSGTSPGGSTNPGTNGRMIGSVRYEGSNKYSGVRMFRDGAIMGWDFFRGSSTDYMSSTVEFGKTFDSRPIVTVSFAGRDAFADGDVIIPTGDDNFSGGAVGSTYFEDVTTTNYLLGIHSEGGTFSNSFNFVFTWRAEGVYT